MYNAPVTTALRPVFPPVNTTIMDCTNAAWVVTPRRFPIKDIAGMEQAIRRNCTRVCSVSKTHRSGGSGEYGITLAYGLFKALLYYRCFGVGFQTELGQQRAAGTTQSKRLLGLQLVYWPSSWCGLQWMQRVYVCDPLKVTVDCMCSVLARPISPFSRMDRLLLYIMVEKRSTGGCRT